MEIIFVIVSFVGVMFFFSIMSTIDYTNENFAEWPVIGLYVSTIAFALSLATCIFLYSMEEDDAASDEQTTVVAQPDRVIEEDRKAVYRSPINSVDDIKGQKIAAGTGTDNYNHAKHFGASVVPATDFQTAMSMIDQGRVKGAFNSKEAFLTWKKDHKNTDLKYIEIPESKLPISEIAPIYNKKSTKLSKKVTKATKELYKDGTMKKLSVKYFGEDITKK